MTKPYLYSKERLEAELLLRSQGKNSRNFDTGRVDQLVSVGGDGTGTTNMATTAAVYKVAPPAGWIYALKRINVYVEDGVNQKFGASKYGAVGALSNGIDISVENASGRLGTLNPLPIKKIGHWGLPSGVDMVFTDFASGESDMGMVRWTFTKGGGAVVLNGDDGEFLRFNVRDDLSALVEHYAQVQGIKFR